MSEPSHPFMTPGLGRSNIPGCNKQVVSRHVVGVEDKNVGSGAQARFDALYRETSGPLLSYAVRRVQSPADAADVVAETFVVAWRRLEDVPRPEGEARAWLYGVARKVLANHYRSETRRSEMAKALRTELTRVETQVHHTPSLIEVAMEGLTKADQELLRLSAWEGLSTGELAIALDCSSSAARVRLHRARTRLSKQLQRTSRTPPDTATTTSAFCKEASS